MYMREKRVLLRHYLEQGVGKSERSDVRKSRMQRSGADAVL